MKCIPLNPPRSIWALGSSTRRPWVQSGIYISSDLHIYVLFVYGHKNPRSWKRHSSWWRQLPLPPPHKFGGLSSTYIFPPPRNQGCSSRKKQALLWPARPTPWNWQNPWGAERKIWLQIPLTPLFISPTNDAFRGGKRRKIFSLAMNTDCDYFLHVGASGRWTLRDKYTPGKIHLNFLPEVSLLPLCQLSHHAASPWGKIPYQNFQVW